MGLLNQSNALFMLHYRRDNDAGSEVKKLEGGAARLRAFIFGRLSPPLHSLAEPWRSLFAPPHAPSEPDLRLIRSPPKSTPVRGSGLPLAPIK
jgi:hypothetical protein